MRTSRRIITSVLVACFAVLSGCEERVEPDLIDEPPVPQTPAVDPNAPLTEAEMHGPDWTRHRFDEMPFSILMPPRWRVENLESGRVGVQLVGPGFAEIIPMRLLVVQDAGRPTGTEAMTPQMVEEMVDRVERQASDDPMRSAVVRRTDSTIRVEQRARFFFEGGDSVQWGVTYFIFSGVGYNRYQFQLAERSEQTIRANEPLIRRMLESIEVEQ